MFKLPSKGTLKQILYVCITFQAYVFRGITGAFLSFFIHQLNFPDSNIKLDNSQQSWIAACLTLLSPIGSLMIGFFMDFIGRRHSLKIIYVAYVISWTMMAYSTNVTILYVTFLIQGIGIGMSQSVSIYVSEITTPNYRGALFALIELNYNSGKLLNNFVMYFLPWRTVALIFSGLGIFSIILNSFLPESPIWLYLKGDHQKSIQTLCSIRCLNEDELSVEIQELERFCTLKKENDSKKTIQNCLNAWKQLSIIIALYVLANNTGSIIVTVFFIQIVNQLNVPYDVGQMAVTYSFVGLITSLIMPYFFHKFNRKTILSCSSIGMGISMLTVVLYQKFGITSNFTWIIPAAFYFYGFCLNMGMLPIIFTMSGEILPNESRGVLNGIFGTVSLLYLSFLLKISSLYMANFGVTVFICTLAISCSILTAFAVFILPETRGKSLHRIQEEYFIKKQKI